MKMLKKYTIIMEKCSTIEKYKKFCKKEIKQISRNIEKLVTYRENEMLEKNFYSYKTF